MSIIVQAPYTKEDHPFQLIDFHRNAHQFVKRPPYQRKNVWPPKLKKALLNSFFQGHYVPNIVLREIHTTHPDSEYDVLKYEVVDGQQRVNTIQEFFNDGFRLSNTPNDKKEWAGKKYSELSQTVKDYIDGRVLEATKLTSMHDPTSKKNQKIVAKVFWNLQQGKNLSFMEVEHSKIYSASRNFITKNADEISFDYPNYLPRNNNPDRHAFFKLINIDNKRLQHLALLGRFLLLEFNNGPTDLGQNAFSNFIDDWNDRDQLIFDKKRNTKRCSTTLDVLYAIFKNDPSAKQGGVVPELNREYLIISAYLLTRRLILQWNFTKSHYEEFRLFFSTFHERWRSSNQNDDEMRTFRENRQQNTRSVETRDQLLTKWFFEYAPKLDRKDPQRNFTFHQRISIYRNDHGICQQCKTDGLSDEKATVPWNDFDADHLKPHSKGGKTSIRNGQVLCRRHNQSKGASI